MSCGLQEVCGGRGGGEGEDRRVVSGASIGKLRETLHSFRLTLGTRNEAVPKTRDVSASYARVWLREVDGKDVTQLEMLRKSYRGCLCSNLAHTHYAQCSKKQSVPHQ